MSSFCVTREEYTKDKRIACKYGSKCYQKNQNHLEKYKHPPRKNLRENGDKVEEGPSKKIKLDETVIDSPEDVEEPPQINDDSTDEEEPRTATIEEIIVEDPKSFIKDKFLVEMPEDFYQFWEFCKNLNQTNPFEALKPVGLRLVGPFDAFSTKLKLKSDLQPEDFLLHWRYYYDPPEFQTVLKGDDSSGFHIGYFRDSPSELPVFLAGNQAKKGGTIFQMGENIFAAVNTYLEDLKKTGDPFKKMHVGKFQNLIKKEAESLKLDMSQKSAKMKMRIQKVVTKTFNTVGLVVPFDKKTKLGYRDLAMKDSELKVLLGKLSKADEDQRQKLLSDLQPVITYASIAADECDFGTGLELALDIFAFGIDSLNSTVCRFFTNSYRLIGKETFAKIAEAHLENRRKGCLLSIFET